MFRNLSFLLLLALATPVAAQERGTPADKSMILALENAWNQAAIHHDAAAAEAILADTFFSIDHTGKLETRAQYIADIKDTSFQSEQVSNIDPSVYIYGNTAIVTSAYRNKGAYKGKPFLHHTVSPTSGST